MVIITRDNASTLNAIRFHNLARVYHDLRKNTKKREENAVQYLLEIARKPHNWPTGHNLLPQELTKQSECIRAYDWLIAARLLCLPSNCATMPASAERTMALEALLGQKRQDVLRIADKYGARRVRMFGSMARGEADAQSDVDVLVDLEPGRPLLDLGGLQFELEALFGRPVDVVTERGLKPRIRDRVLREAVPV
jgi:predicted nucleotidyltransferase